MVFQQKDDAYLSEEKKTALNKEEVEKYKTRFQLVEETEPADGAILVHVRKQYNDKTDVAEFLE